MTHVEKTKPTYKHPFGRENETSLKQLLKFFCNNVYLGQWELARACVQDLYKYKDIIGDDIDEILIDIAQNPYNSSLGSESLSNPHYLSWLSYLELSQLNGNSDQKSYKYIQEDVEFRLLLHFIKCPHIQDFYTYHQEAVNIGKDNAHTKRFPSLPTHCRNYLIELLLKNPAHGHYIIYCLTFVNKPELKVQNEVLQMLYADAINRVILHIKRICKSGGSDENIPEQVDTLYRLLSLFDPSPFLKKITVRQIFIELLILLNVEGKQVINLQQIYSALIGRSNNFLIDEFCHLQYTTKFEKRKKDDSGSTILASQGLIVPLVHNPNRAESWHEWFLLCTHKDVHFLDIIMDTCLNLVKSGKFDVVSSLLEAQELAALKPLVLLMGWQYCSCIEDASVLIEQLHVSQSNLKEKAVSHVPLNQACKQLAYQVQLVKWCIEKTKDYWNTLTTKGTRLSAPDTVMFASLESQSVLQILNNCTQLSALSTDDVLDILQKSPVLDAEGTQAVQKKEKSVRFAIEGETDSKLEYPLMSVGQERDIAIYKAYTVLRDIMNCINFMADTTSAHTLQTNSSSNVKQPSETEGNANFQTFQEVYDHFVVTKLNFCKEMLSSLHPLPYRMETLENVFSLLFLRNEDEQEATITSDVGEDELVDVTRDLSLQSQISVESTEKEEENNATVKTSEATNQDTALNVHQEISDQQNNIKSKNPAAKGILTTDSYKPTTLHQAAVLSQPDSTFSSATLRNSTKVGFVVNEYLVRDLLTLLKESLTSLSAAKFSLEGEDARYADKSSEELLQSHVSCSIKSCNLQHRISRLTKFVSEATWRFQLVSHGKIPKKFGVVNEEPSERTMFGRTAKDVSGRDGQSNKASCLKPNHGYSPGQGNFTSFESENQLTTDGSVSAASTSSQRQKIKRSKKERGSHDRTLQLRRGIIPRMLASHETLLFMCLRRDNYSQAKQVLQMFDLSYTALTAEVQFAESFKSTVQKIVNFESKDESQKTTSSTYKGNMHSMKKPSLSKIAKFAAAGISSMSVTGIVDELLSYSNLPHFQQDVAMDTNLSHHLNSDLIPSVVIVDLACAASSSWKTFNDLLHMAKSRLPVHRLQNEFPQKDSHLNVHKSSRTEYSPVAGVLEFINNLLLVSDLGKIDSTTTIFPEIIPLFYQKNASQTLLSTTRPLDSVAIKQQVALYVELNRSLQRVENSLNEASTWEIKNVKKKKPIVRMAMKQLMQNMLKNVPPGGLGLHLLRQMNKASTGASHGGVSNKFRYLQSLYEHVKALATLQNECDAPSQDASSTEYFLMLQESPTEMMGRLIFTYRVPPPKLENVAEKLNVNLTQIIVNNCCPLVPSMRSKALPLQSTNGTLIGQKLILNVGYLDTEHSYHPESLVRGILTRLIQLMKDHAQKQNTSGTFDIKASKSLIRTMDYRHIIQSTSALQFVDLAKLQTKQDKLCFYANLINLFTIHVCLFEVERQLMGKPMFTSQTSLTESIKSNNEDTEALSDFLIQADNVSLPIGVLDRLMLQMKFAYNVGQLGAISLYELRHSIIRHGMEPPFIMNSLIKDRSLDLDPCDPWLLYGPEADSRLLFVLTEGAASSPILQVLTPELLEQELDVSMNAYLSQHIHVNSNKNQVIIPQLLHWYWRDFIDGAGEDVTRSLDMLHWLSSAVTGPLQASLQQTLDASLSSNAKGNDSSSSSSSFPCEIVVQPFKRDFRFSFDYSTTSSSDTFYKTHRRGSSLPSALLKFSPQSRSRGSSFIRHSVSRTDSLKSHHLTPVTLDYLKAHSALVATLVSLVCPDELDDIQNDFDDNYFASMEDLTGGSPSDVSNFSLVDVRSYRYQRLTGDYPTMYSHVLHQIVPLCAVRSPQLLTSADPVLKLTTSKMDDDLRQYILHMPDSQQFRNRLLQIVKNLVQDRSWTRIIGVLLSVSEAAIKNSPELLGLEDFIFCCAAVSDESNDAQGVHDTHKWRYLLYIRDNETMARAVLGSLKRWSIEVCVNLLDMCSRLVNVNPHLLRAVKARLSDMKIYEKITQCAKRMQTERESSGMLPVPDPQSYLNKQVLQALCSWQQVIEKSSESPEEVLELVLDSHEFDVARQWAAIHHIPQTLKQVIEQNYIYYLLENENADTVKAYQVLEDFKLTDAEQCLSVCDDLLTNLKDNNNILFITKFIILNLQSQLHDHRIHHLQLVCIGANALLCIPSPARTEYEHLQASPMLILEQLLMNSKVEWAEKVVKSMKRNIESMGMDFKCNDLCTLENIDTLLTSYATKALEVPIIQDDDSGGRDSVLGVGAGTHLDANMRRSASRASVSSNASLMSALTLSPRSGYSSRVSMEKAFTQKSHSPSPGSSPQLHEGLHRGFQTFNKAVQDEPFVIPPVAPPREQWVPDGSVTHCMACKMERFTMFNRRHHCRRCGRVVCSTCSLRTTIIRGKSSRTCDQCFRAMFKPRQTPQDEKPKEDSLGLSPGQTALSPGASFVAERVAASSPVYDQWMLSSDAEENQAIREEFYYDTAPNASLCISILGHHSDPRQSGHVMLSLCDTMSKLLRPVAGQRNPEVDYNQVLSIVKYLLFHAKMVLVRVGDVSGMEQCEEFRAVLDLLMLLVSNNCAYIPSVLQLTKADAVRRLRDKLIEDERLPLAMEVSAKCGINATGVWAAWGMACLKTADYAGAREKFAKCLKPPSDKNHVQPTQKLLGQILAHLQSAGAAHSVLSILQQKLSPKELIMEPTYTCIEDAMTGDDTVTQETWYYLDTYAGYSTIVTYHLNQNNYLKAVQFILEKKCSSEIFLECLFLPSLSCGELSRLEECLMHVDPSLEKWQQYLTNVCRHMNRARQTHTLYQLQLFMKDYIRASMTCITDFYERDCASYTHLFHNAHHLLNAKKHMEDYLEQVMRSAGSRGGGGGRQVSPSPSWQSPPKADPPVRISLTAAEVNRHINTISLQIEVTKFLHRYLGAAPLDTGGAVGGAASPEGGSQKRGKLPTLFGSNKVKAEVVHIILMAGHSVNDGFGLAFRIIQEFRLNATVIYTHTARQLAKENKHVSIRHLLDCISNSGLCEKQSFDEVIRACIRLMADDQSQTKEIEHLIKMMKIDSNKINAYILCGKLKSAYLIAVKEESVEDIRCIAGAAERSGQLAVKRISEQWLKQHDKKT